ncbi:MAG TPA: hypothetical protein VIY29_13470 [Ktedonobacteraceae bacterium]
MKRLQTIEKLDRWAFTTISYFRFCLHASAPERGIAQENLL